MIIDKKQIATALVAFASGTGAGAVAAPPETVTIEKAVYKDPGDAQNAMRALCRAAQVTRNEAIITEECDRAPYYLESRAKSLVAAAGPRVSPCANVPEGPALVACEIDDAHKRRALLEEQAASRVAKMRIQSEDDQRARCGDERMRRRAAGLPPPKPEDCAKL